MVDDSDVVFSDTHQCILLPDKLPKCLNISFTNIYYFHKKAVQSGFYRNHKYMTKKYFDNMSAIIASYCKCLIEASSFGIFCDVTVGMHIHLYCNRCLELRLNSNLFLLFSAGDHAGGQGLAWGSHAGLFRAGSRVRWRHCLLQLQQARQQLPLWCRLGVFYQFLHFCAGHPGGVCRVGLQSQYHEQQMCCNVSIRLQHLQQQVHWSTCFRQYFFILQSLNVVFLKIVQGWLMFSFLTTV